MALHKQQYAFLAIFLSGPSTDKAAIQNDGTAKDNGLRTAILSLVAPRVSHTKKTMQF